MATIEPRLIHLLNGDNKGGYLPPNALPPLHSLPYSKSAALPVSLPSLGLELDKRAEQLPSKLPSTSVASHQIPSFASFVGDDTPRRPTAVPLAPAPTHEYDGSARIKSASNSIRALLEDSSPVEPSHSLRLILADEAAAPSELPLEDASTKKRHRAMTVKEDFVQLPQPLKKQKSAQQVMPPIINGLHEPPPNAAFFPPIASVDFGAQDSLSLNPLKEFTGAPDERPAPATPTDDKPAASVKTRRRTKPRRKWTELETNHLLLGVSRHGVGKWTNILEDPDFHFVDRTAGDLKDRFRTCCPDELRGSNGSIGVKATAYKGNNSDKYTAAGSPSDLSATGASCDANPNAKRTLNLENLLAGDEEPDCNAASSNWFMPEADAPPKPRKSRAHRKKLEDLVELGIRGPFKKSHRRERRPFTEQDDQEILQGIRQYGPAWTRIQRDENFNLSSRQPTDLRDRVRNKYPDIYAKIEKGGIQIKEPSRTVGVLEPTVNMTIENSLDPQLNRTSSKDSIQRWTLDPVAETSASSQQHVFDINDHPASAYQGNVGEMDISRLLLSDAQQV
ncbi:hypothetical protein RB595_009985 [Gaeumannomyces hyphopodioides]